MEDIKLWELDGTQAMPLGSNNELESEEKLEETLVENPNLLMEDLTLVGRQTSTEGGPLDLLGVDGDGRLVVFELKRGTLSRDAVAQIIDYASYLDDMDMDTLAEHISDRSGEYGIKKIEDFEEWYSQDFGALEGLRPLRMFLVGLGVDDRTERMVSFLANNGDMDISLLTFHCFDYDGKTILAKQVEVEGVDDADSEPGRRRRRRSRTELQEHLNQKIRDSETSELFDDVLSMFRDNWSGLWHQPGTLGLLLKLQNTTGTGRYVTYTRIDPESGRVRIVFFPRAIALSENEFRQPVEKIPYETWPRNREPLPLGDTYKEIQFLLTEEEWKTHKETLIALVQSIYVAWQDEGQDDGADSVESE